MSQVKQLRDEGEIQNECDGPCFKLMLKVQGGLGLGVWGVCLCVWGWGLKQV